MHPASLAVIVRLRARAGPAAPAWALALRYGDGGVVQVAADQAEVQVPALRAAAGPLDPGRDDAGSHGEIMRPAASRSRQVRTVRSDSPA